MIYILEGDGDDGDDFEMPPPVVLTQSEIGTFSARKDEPLKEESFFDPNDENIQIDIPDSWADEKSGIVILLIIIITIILKSILNLCIRKWFLCYVCVGIKSKNSKFR